MCNMWQFAMMSHHSENYLLFSKSYSIIYFAWVRILISNMLNKNVVDCDEYTLTSLMSRLWQPKCM